MSFTSTITFITTPSQKYAHKGLCTTLIKDAFAEPDTTIILESYQTGYRTRLSETAGEDPVEEPLTGIIITVLHASRLPITTLNTLEQELEQFYVAEGQILTRFNKAP